MQDLLCKDVSKNTATVCWSEPLDESDSTIVGYIVEKRDISHTAWHTVSTNCTRLLFKVINLIEGSSYVFRVSAENKFGIGESAATTEPITCNEVPSPPLHLQIQEVSNIK